LAAYHKLKTILEQFCRVSNARFNKSKTIAIKLKHITTEDNQGHEPSWYGEIQETPHLETEDYIHLGCALRTDGQIPHESLDKLLNKIRTQCYIWRARNLNFKGRITTVNSHILSMIWHMIQICPLPKNFHNQINKIVSTFVFNSERAPFLFEETCYPTHMGGLGIIQPESMLLALSGAAIARDFSDQSPTAKAFRLSFLRELHRVGACFFRLFSEGKFHKVNEMTPYWQRVYSTILGLGLSMDEEWDKYTDEEILGIPIISSQTIPQEIIKAMAAKRIRPGLLGARMFFLRDILVWTKATEPLAFISPDHGTKRIFGRMQKWMREELYVNNEYVGYQSNRYIQGRTALSDLRKIWPQILQHLPDGLKTRLHNIKTRPLPGEPLYPLVFQGIDFNVGKIHDIIPWTKLRLAGQICKNYDIKSARKHAQRAKLIIPNWIPGQEIRLPQGFNEKVFWKDAWKTLNWKSRPPKHYEAYWYLLHKRTPRFRPKRTDEEQVDSDEQEGNDRGNWHLRLCELCNKKDDHIHGYFECPDVQDIWKFGLKLLSEMVGKTTIRDYTNTFTSVLLAFHQIRRRLRKPLRARVLLLHSTIIYLIYSRRWLEMQGYNGKDEKIRIDYQNPSWKQEIYTSLQTIMNNIYQDYKNKLQRFTDQDPTGKAWENTFHRNWVNECSLWKMGNDKLEFTFTTL
jgi:hypothetical protein